MDLKGLNIKGLLPNFEDSDYESISNLKIYRYFSLDNLIDTLFYRKLFLKKPYKWDDPFENLFLRSKIIDTEGLEQDFSLMKEQIFAQCWTFTEESDLMWSKFITDKRGARVTTTIRNLLSFVYKLNFAFIGKVKYMSESEIFEYFSTVLPFNVHSTTIYNTLLIKRETFSEEKELRLIFYDLFRGQPSDSKVIVANWNLADYESDFCFIPINPNVLFSEIILHPRMNDKDVSEAIVSLKEHYHGIIKKSNLYDVPNITIRINKH